MCKLSIEVKDIGIDKDGQKTIGIFVESSIKDKLLYKFFESRNGTWKVIKNFTSDSYVNWKLKEYGKYMIMVQAKKVDSKKSFDYVERIEYIYNHKKGIVKTVDENNTNKTFKSNKNVSIQDIQNANLEKYEQKMKAKFQTEYLNPYEALFEKKFAQSENKALNDELLGKDKIVFRKDDEAILKDKKAIGNNNSNKDEVLIEDNEDNVEENLQKTFFLCKHENKEQFDEEFNIESQKDYDINREDEFIINQRTGYDKINTKSEVIEEDIIEVVQDTSEDEDIIESIEDISENEDKVEVVQDTSEKELKTMKLPQKVLDEDKIEEEVCEENVDVYEEELTFEEESQEECEEEMKEQLENIEEISLVIDKEHNNSEELIKYILVSPRKNYYIGSQIIFTLILENSDNIINKYRLFINDKLIEELPYKEDKSFVFIPRYAGDYRIEFYAKYKHSDEEYLQKKVQYFCVNAAEVIEGMGISCDRTVIKCNKDVTFMTTVKGGQNVIYEFYILKENKWILVQEYSKKSYYTLMPFKEGSYRLLVLAKNYDSKEDYDEFIICKFNVQRNDNNIEDLFSIK